LFFPGLYVLNARKLTGRMRKELVAIEYFAAQDQLSEINEHFGRYKQAAVPHMDITLSIISQT